MTSDQHDSQADRVEAHSVLPASTSSDTSGLGIIGGATAQVSVPLAYANDDDLDDDVVDGEVAVDEISDDGPEVASAPDVTADGEGDAARAAESDLASEPAVEPERFAESVSDASDVPVSDVPDELEARVAHDPEPDAVAAEEIAVDRRTADPVIDEPVPADEGDEAEEAPAADLDSDDRIGEDEASPAVMKEPTMDETRSRHPELALRSKRLDQFDSERESADLLTPDRLLDHGRIAGPEPEGAWQHFVYSVSGGRINLGDGKRARARKSMDARIAAPLHGGARFVPVLSRKGGVGKTTVTTLLGMALADARDDRVIAIDANPDRGTLAERIARPSGKTVRDLVRAKDDVGGYNDVSGLVTRDQTRLDVLASDTDPRVSEAFSDTDYDEVATLAAHYYSLVLTDTGTGIVHAVMGATLARADQLVIVAGLSIDEARLASETLTWLETNGYAEQVRSAIVVLNHGRPGAPLVRASELETHFSTRVRTVVQMPYDPAIATGSAIGFRELSPETRAAARELAAAVVEGLRGAAAAA